MRRSLDEYRESLELVDGGTVPVSLALEIIRVAEDELEARATALTLPEAIERSGRSREWFERRLARWVKEGKARKRGQQWFLDADVVPSRRAIPREGFDPTLSDDEILERIRTAS